MADELAARFAAAGHRLYLVGGSVRDALLGRAVDDLDFATDARPDAVLELLAGWADAVWDTGIAFGTVGARRRGVRWRSPRSAPTPTTGSPATRWSRTATRSTSDLLRRDFTVNAMAVALTGRERTFVDPYGGLAALATGALDTPAAPEESFADDPLRMLRAARFVSQLGFTPAPRVVAAMTAMAGRAGPDHPRAGAGRAVQADLGAHPRRGIELLVDTGLAELVLPELPALRMEIDEHHQHKDVYAHSLTVLDQAIERETDGPDLVLRLAALLHDVGKPETRRKEPDGRVSFHHHEVVGAKLVRRRLRELSYPKAVVDDVARLVYLHLRFHGYGSGEWTDSAVRRYVTDAGPLLDRLHKLVRSDCTTRNRRRAAALQRSYDSLEERIAALREQEDLARSAPTWTATRSCRCSGCRPGRWSARA